MLFALAPHGWRVRVFDLQPMLGPAGDIARAAPLRYDSFAAKLACVLEDIRAGSVKDAIDDKRRPAADQQLR